MPLLLMRLLTCHSSVVQKILTCWVDPMQKMVRKKTVVRPWWLLQYKNYTHTKTYLSTLSFVRFSNLCEKVKNYGDHQGTKKSDLNWWTKKDTVWIFQSYVRTKYSTYNLYIHKCIYKINIFRPDLLINHHNIWRLS